MRARQLVALPAVAATAYLVGRRAARTGDGTRSPATAEDVADPVLGAVQAARDLPGIDAGNPTEIPPAGWRQIVRRAIRETKRDGIPLMAAGVAFYAFVSLFPALIAAVTVYGLVADPAQVQEQVRSLAGALPPESAQVLGDQLTEIAAGSRRALGIGLVVSLAGALLSASSGVTNVIKAVNLAYDEEETRSLLALRALALLLTLAAVVFVAVAVGIIVVLPVVLDSVGLGSSGRLAVEVLRWVGLIVFVAASLAILYRYAPDRDHPRLSWVSLGAAVSTLLWVLGSLGFSLYVRTFGNYSETYGALAGVIVLLLWLFLTALIVLLGAEINSETEHQTARDSTVGPPKPLGERNAVKADTLPSRP